MGLDQYRRGAALVRAAGGGLHVDHPRHRRRSRVVVDELHAKRGGDRGDGPRRRRLHRRRRPADQAEHRRRSEPAADLRTHRRIAQPAGRLRAPERRDPRQSDLRPQPAAAAAECVGRHVSAGARTADAAEADPVPGAAAPEEHRRSELRLRGAEGLSDARRQGAEGRQEPDRLLVRARLGGARLSRRALCAGPGAAESAPRGDARHGFRAGRARSRSTARWSRRRKRPWRACASQNAPTRC